MATREEKIERLRKLERLKMLETQRAAQQPQPTEARGVGPTDLAQSFNKGLVDLINLPSEVVNVLLGAVGAPQIPTQEFRQKVADIGFTAQPGEEAEGFLPRSAEILGASVLPAAAIQRAGAQVLKAGIPAAQRTIPQALTAITAEAPGKAALIDISSSIGAGFGGEVAAQFTDDPGLIVLGELAGGFTLPSVTAISRFAGKPVVSKIRETITPFTKAGAEPRAARRLQDLVPDPEAAAARIDVESPISPARQTGDPRLIALEKTVLAQNPELEARFTDELNGALDAARQQATAFGGENRFRSILEGGQEHLTNLVDLRAAKAAQVAQIRIDSLGIATPRDISRIARSELDTALKDARIQETELWGSVGKKITASFDNAKSSVAALKAEESKLVPTKIPGWLKKAIETDADINFNDLLKVRSKLLESARAASKAGKFDKARTLNTIANGNERLGIKGILDDMAAVNDPNVKAARAFSAQLNQKFTEGSVGALLSRGADRGAGVASADTLKKLFSGATPATNVRAFLNASPQSAPQMQQFMKANFAKSSTRGGQFSDKLAEAQITKLENQGMFEIFPDLKGELGGIRLGFREAENLAQRAATVTERGGSRLVQDSNESLAGVLLGAEPGQELSVLLRAEKPEALAATLVRRMGGNKDAIQGLKSEFVETLFRESSTTGASGEIEISGQKLAKIFNQNIGVAKSLGMDEKEITRMRAITKQMIQAQQQPGVSVGAILEDKPAALMTFIARVAGAKFGQKIAGGGIGSALVIAGEGSTQARNILQKLTTNEAQKLLISAQSDPVLYKALLTRTSATQNEIFDATQIIESWLIGAGVEASFEPQDDRFRLRQGSENVGVTEQLNLGAQ